MKDGLDSTRLLGSEEREGKIATFHHLLNLEESCICPLEMIWLSFFEFYEYSGHVIWDSSDPYLFVLDILLFGKKMNSIITSMNGHLEEWSSLVLMETVIVLLKVIHIVYIKIYNILNIYCIYLKIHNKIKNIFDVIFWKII